MFPPAPLLGAGGLGVERGNLTVGTLCRERSGSVGISVFHLLSYHRSQPVTESWSQVCLNYEVEVSFTLVKVKKTKKNSLHADMVALFVYIFFA